MQRLPHLPSNVAPDSSMSHAGSLQEPTNDVYKKALEMTHQAPALHAELQKQIQASQVRSQASRG